MTEQHVDNYRHLISVLLTYPNQAAKVLNKNQKLINTDFVQLIEQLSEKMATTGNQAAAEFLLSLAAQIRREFLNVVVEVGQERITASEMVARLTRYQMLPQFLSEVIVDQAIAPIYCTPEEIANACQEFYAQNQLTNEATRQAWCEHNRLTLEQVEALAIRPLKIVKFQQATWGDKLESYFLERKDHLDQVSYSLIRLKDAGLAQELYFRLEEGEQSFAELARQYSQGPERQNDGLIGPILMKMLHPRMIQMFKASQPGQVLPPAQIEEWLVLARLEKFIPARLDASMRRRLLNELFQSWLSEQLNQQAIRLTTPQSISSALPQLAA